jgi:hypothetical protein
MRLTRVFQIAISLPEKCPRNGEDSGPAGARLSAPFWGQGFDIGALRLSTVAGAKATPLDLVLFDGKAFTSDVGHRYV